nr:MAG TPA: hypothetical protein [Caudoviricetes sp.]
MKKTFALEVNDYDVKELSDRQFLSMDIWAISTGINRNMSEFLEESFETAIQSFYNKPVLAYYNTTIGDTEEHNSSVNFDEDGQLFWDYQYNGAEHPVGLIPEGAEITVQERDGKKWIHIRGALLWYEYNHQLGNLLKKKGNKKVSVEVEFLDSYMDGEVEKVKSFVFLGITILGTDPNTMKEIEEGIEGARLELSGYTKSEEFVRFKQKMSFAYNKMNVLKKYNIEIPEKNNEHELYALEITGDIMNKEEFLAKSEWGTEDPIEVDKSKDAVSNDSWGDVDKTALRNKVLKAKNYKTLVKSVYLLVEDGWEDSPSSHLKYPVMQYKNGTMVYNAGGLLSAQQYGEKYDESIANKAKRIRKKLGLIETEKRDSMNKFIEFARDSANLIYIGSMDGKYLFVKEADEAEDDKKEMSVFEIEKEKTEMKDCEGCEEFDWDELTERSVKLAEDENCECFEEKEDKEEMSAEGKEIEMKPDDEHEKFDEDEDEDDEEEHKDEEDEDDKEDFVTKDDYEALKCQYADLEAKYNVLAAEKEEARVLKMKEDTDAILADEDEDLDEKDKEDLCALRDAGEFADVEAFVRELSYRKYTAKKKVPAKVAYSARTTSTKKNEVVDDLDKI